MIFDLFATPQGPLRQGPKEFAVACDIAESNSHTKSGWPPNIPRHPQVPLLGHDQGDQIKIPSEMFCIFHLWEDKQSLI